MPEVKEYYFYELPFGPAHPGPGNFMLEVDGERIVRARSDPGCLHRGFEKLMEYRAMSRTPCSPSGYAFSSPILEPGSC